MDEAMVASLLSIDCELNLLHNIKPIFKPKARALLMQQQRMAKVTSFSPEVIGQYDIALSSIEDSDADYQSLTEYAMSVILLGDSTEELDFAESEVQRICRTFGVTPVREGWVTQATFLTSSRLMKLFRGHTAICRVWWRRRFALKNLPAVSTKATGGRGRFRFSEPRPVRPTSFSSMSAPKKPRLPTVVLSVRPVRVKRHC